MKKIGFVQQPRKEDKFYHEQLIVRPERNANLTLQKRESLIRLGIGRPLPKTLQFGQDTSKNNILVFHRSYNPFRQATLTRQEALAVYCEGAVSFESWLMWNSPEKPWYDADESTKRLIEECVRGINFVSTIQPEGIIHLEIVVEGIYGSQLIFNPHEHETYRTRCVVQQPIHRSETINISGSRAVIPELKDRMLNFVNEILGKFQADGYFEYLSSEEFSPLFDAEFSRLKFGKGLFASPGEDAVRMGLKPVRET